MTGPKSGIHKNKTMDQLTWREISLLVPHEPFRYDTEILLDIFSSEDKMSGFNTDQISALNTYFTNYFYPTLVHHHDAEEELYFPWLSTRTEIPLKLTAEHSELMIGMDKIKLELNDYNPTSTDEEKGQWASNLRQIATSVFTLLMEHLDEEDDLTPKLLQSFTQEEEKEIVVGKIIPFHGDAVNAYFIPWVLFAMEKWAGSEFAAMWLSQALPPPVQELAKGAWKQDFDNNSRKLLAKAAPFRDTYGKVVPVELQMSSNIELRQGGE